MAAVSVEGGEPVAPPLPPAEDVSRQAHPAAVLGTSVWAGLVYAAALAFYAAGRHSFSLKPAGAAALAAGLSLSAGLLARRLAARRPAPAGTAAEPRAGARQSRRQPPVADPGWRALVPPLAVALAVRVIWVLVVEPVQVSDFASYLNLARELLAEGTFGGGGAFRPPGYPFLLAGGLRVLGDHPWTPAVLNLVVAGATVVVAGRLAGRLGGGLGDARDGRLGGARERRKDGRLGAAQEGRKGGWLLGARAGLLAAWGVALWPSHVAVTGLAQSETPTALLLLAVVALATAPSATRLWNAALGGVLVGLAVLVRSSLALLPALWMAAAVLRPGERLRLVRSGAVVLVCAAAVVAPWTARNHRALGGFLLVSSNGGSVFYRANNPLADGRFTREGARDLDALRGDEVLWSRTGFAWGREWIRAHPGEFLRLAFVKQALFLGSDADGFYWTLERGHGRPRLARRARRLAGLWWAAVWVLLAAGLVAGRRRFAADGRLVLLGGLVLYLLAVHSVFESKGRYHEPVVPVIAVLAALAPFPRGARPG